ncbi:MAG: hypothetical protein NXY59_03965 [Aigarchaeota archaeon]|nr:hypothetical protein [Candidatus Pelearchaeum maunauluense]
MLLPYRGEQASMHYRELVRAVRLEYSGEDFSEFPEEPYPPDMRAPEYYKALHQRDHDSIIVFLRKWNPRVRFSKPRLRRILESSGEQLSQLSDEHLLNANLRLIRPHILTLFERFSKVLKYTGAAKALHILAPNLLVMWDAKIREAYRCAPNGEGYYNFHLRMREELSELAESYAKETSIRPDNALSEIEQRLTRGGAIPITRMLDIYNYHMISGRRK